MTEEIKTNFSNIHNEIKNKLKLPVIITYSIVLIIFNWDILFYLAFQKSDALYKIQYVKANFFTVNFDRIWKPILYALCYSIMFPFLQVFINQIVKYFKNINNKITRKEEIDNAIHNFDVQQQLTGRQSLEQLQNKIDQLLLEKQELITTNNSLISQLKTESSEVLDSNQILNSEYEKSAKEILKDVNKLNNEEKSTFIELISIIPQFSTSSYTIEDLMKKTIFPLHVKKTMDILKKNRLIEQKQYSDYHITNALGLKTMKYFKLKYVK